MYCWYLRNTYLENKLATRGALTVCGEPLDLGAITMPSYVYGSREDHIVPWKGAYRNAQVLERQEPFRARRLGPHRRRHQSAVEEQAQPLDRGNAALPAIRRAWLEMAEEQPGQLVDDWAAWLKPFAGKQVAAPKTAGNKTWRPIEPAPGRYVKEKA